MTTFVDDETSDPETEGLSPIDDLEVGESTIIPWIDAWSIEQTCALVTCAVLFIEDQDDKEFSAFAMPQGVVVTRELSGTRNKDRGFVVQALNISDLN